MKKLIFLVLVLAALPAFAQEATLNSTESVTISATKLAITAIHITPTNADVVVDFKANDGTVKRSATYATGSGAPLVSFITALGTSRSGETGTAPRRFSFRCLGWLADNNKFTDVDGNPIAVTLVP